MILAADDPIWAALTVARNQGDDLAARAITDLTERPTPPRRPNPWV